MYFVLPLHIHSSLFLSVFSVIYVLKVNSIVGYLKCFKARLKGILYNYNNSWQLSLSFLVLRYITYLFDSVNFKDLLFFSFSIDIYWFMYWIIGIREILNENNKLTTNDTYDTHILIILHNIRWPSPAWFQALGKILYFGTIWHHRKTTSYVNGVIFYQQILSTFVFW